MKQLRTGQFFGKTSKKIQLEEITITDTIYTEDKVDWHYHENAYFTFILRGKLTEGNKKAVYNCSSGSLLFHYCHEPHYNIKPEGFTRGFHIEINSLWFENNGIDTGKIQGSYNIINSDIKILLYKIFLETGISDSLSAISIQDHVIQIFVRMLSSNKPRLKNKPEWVSKISELLHDTASEPSHKEIIDAVGIHPVHLSRDFSKYFNCNLGEYLRKLKVVKAMDLLSDPEISLTNIAYRCGFSDQSHFIRCFKQVNGIKPSLFRKIVLS